MACYYCYEGVQVTRYVTRYMLHVICYMLHILLRLAQAHDAAFLRPFFFLGFAQLFLHFPLVSKIIYFLHFSCQICQMPMHPPAACRQNPLTFHITSLLSTTEHNIPSSVDTSQNNHHDEPSSRCSGWGNRLKRLPSQQQLFFSLSRLQQHTSSTSRQWQKCRNPRHGNLHSPHIHLSE